VILSGTKFPVTCYLGWPGGSWGRFNRPEAAAVLTPITAGRTALQIWARDSSASEATLAASFLPCWYMLCHCSLIPLHPTMPSICGAWRLLRDVDISQRFLYLLGEC